MDGAKLGTNGVLFPARAGVIPIAISLLTFRGTSPRTRGGDPFSGSLAWVRYCYSPHARG